ncbi:hypothetical protein [uncultured Jatrophihabitans sp.]|uniref:hypothetical protein n=1 Tax=uncultured Jatrophihabitans sp. TaxID=1610747 RepID=UPI0035CC108A
MTRLLIDTSVLIKWFHDAGESELAEARAIRGAHIHGDLDAHVLDLAIYEVRNVPARAALGVSLVSADRKLLAAGLAETPATVNSRLNLRA